MILKSGEKNFFALEMQMKEASGYKDVAAKTQAFRASGNSSLSHMKRMFTGTHSSSGWHSHITKGCVQAIDHGDDNHIVVQDSARRHGRRAIKACMELADMSRGIRQVCAACQHSIDPYACSMRNAVIIELLDEVPFIPGQLLFTRRVV